MGAAGRKGTADFPVCCVAGLPACEPSALPTVSGLATPRRFGNRRYSRLGSLRSGARRPHPLLITPGGRSGRVAGSGCLFAGTMRQARRVSRGSGHPSRDRKGVGVIADVSRSHREPRETRRSVNRGFRLSARTLTRAGRRASLRIPARGPAAARAGSESRARPRASGAPTRRRNDRSEIAQSRRRRT